MKTLDDFCSKFSDFILTQFTLIGEQEFKKGGKKLIYLDCPSCDATLSQDQENIKRVALEHYAEKCSDYREHKAQMKSDIFNHYMLLDYGSQRPLTKAELDEINAKPDLPNFIPDPTLSNEQIQSEHERIDALFAKKVRIKKRKYGKTITSFRS